MFLDGNKFWGYMMVLIPNATDFQSSKSKV